MKIEDSYFQALFQQYAKPTFKQAFSEWLTENQLALVSIKSNDDCLISTPEAIKLFGGIDRHTLYAYIEQGLPARRIGKSYKFRKEDIQKFINDNLGKQE